MGKVQESFTAGNRIKMSVPSVIFIDTCIIEDEGYRFESEKMRAFAAAAKDKKTILLLPDPTRREILGHIKANAEGVIKALEEAKRKAPFLKKWKDWPIKKDILLLTYELHKMALKEWDDFLANFTLIDLDYTDIKMSEIMDWYYKQIAPFGKGKSREFPDAFSFSIVLQYALKNNSSVALLSRDKDFLKAAERYPAVVSFDSISAYTQALIESDSHVKDVQTLLSKDVSVINNAVAKEFGNLMFYPGGDTEGDGTVEDVESNSVSIKNPKVIALGDKQCTVAFDASVKYSAYVKYDSTAEVGDGESHWIVPIKREGCVTDNAEISGVIKIHISDDWKDVAGVDLLSIDEDDIEVSAEPDEYEEYDGPEGYDGPEEYDGSEDYDPTEDEDHGR